MKVNMPAVVLVLMNMAAVLAAACVVGFVAWHCDNSHARIEQRLIAMLENV